jgi:microcystin-dependent protein
MSVTQLTGQQVKDSTVATADIADGAVTDAKVASANKDGTTSTPSMRTLGTSSTQAAPGDDQRFVPTGTIIESAAILVPTGYLFCDGSAVSRTTYAALFAAMVRASTVTISGTTPLVVTWTGHGLKEGDPFKFSTTGSLPTGVTAGTTYYVKYIDANTFNFAATPGGSNVGSVGGATGTTTATVAPHGVGNGTTTFNVPDRRGRAGIGAGAGSGLTERAAGATSGEETHLLTIAEMPAHDHGNPVTNLIAASGLAAGPNINIQTGAQSTGGGGTHNNMQPSIVLNYYIKT